MAAVAVSNLRRDGELAGALSLLAAEGIEVVLLKGAALRARRPELAGRFQCDLDVLLRRRDLERAEALLLAQGFRLDETFRDRAGLLRDHFHLGYERRGAMVELHWDVDPASPPGFAERLWERSVPATLDGRPCRLLAPEHQLLFGCLHLSRHAFHGGLRWLADLALLLSDLQTPRDLARFEAAAREWPRRAVRLPLWFLGEAGVAGAREPGQDGGAGPLERALLRRLLPHVLVAEPWLGIPDWRLAGALHAWLFSGRSLAGLLARAAGRGIRARLRAGAAYEARMASALSPAPSGVEERRR